jgi:hypothetical protein
MRPLPRVRRVERLGSSLGVLRQGFCQRRSTARIALGQANSSNVRKSGLRLSSLLRAGTQSLLIRWPTGVVATSAAD